MTKKIPRNHVICERCLELSMVTDMGPKLTPEQLDQRKDGGEDSDSYRFIPALPYWCPRCRSSSLGKTFDEVICEQEGRVMEEQAELDILKRLEEEYIEPSEKE